MLRLAENIAVLSVDRDIRCIVLRGAGDEAFAAGGDLEEFVTARATLEQALHYHGHVAAALNAIADCPHPTVALIQGACIGGGMEIAGACDLRICGESARFGAPINRLGFSKYPGEMEGLLRLAGAAVMKEILLEGRILSAAEAYHRRDRSKGPKGPDADRKLCLYQALISIRPRRLCHPDHSDRSR